MQKKTESEPKIGLDTLNYETARDELITIVSRLEQGGLNLDDSIALWERGEKLIAHCRAKLQSASQRITDIVESVSNIESLAESRDESIEKEKPH